MPPTRNPWITEALRSRRLLDPWTITGNKAVRFTRLHTRLDFFLTSPKLLSFQPLANIVPLLLSDHHPVSLTMCCLPADPVEQKKRTLQRLSKEEWRELQEGIRIDDDDRVWDKLRKLEHYVRTRATRLMTPSAPRSKPKKVNSPFVSKRNLSAAKGQARIEMSFIKNSSGQLLFDKNDIAAAMECHLSNQTPTNRVNQR